MRGVIINSATLYHIKGNVLSQVNLGMRNTVKLICLEEGMYPKMGMRTEGCL